MANPEHVEVARHGARAIREWQAAHREPFDLAGANLRHADLRGANLSGADLSDANLRSADLSRTDLSGAILARANLSGAGLSGTDLGGALLYETLFAATNLAGAGGLEGLVHVGPSTVDHRTLELSGMLPEAFLRGCGLPDGLIDYYRASYGDGPIEFYSAFISYSTADQLFAGRLYANLQSNGVRCWLASEDLRTGDRFRDVIDRAIRVHDKLMVLLTEDSIASDWVQSEVKNAFEKERRDGSTVLFPIRLDDAVMETDKAWAAEIRRTRHIGDFRGWKDHDAYQPAFERLLRDLKAGVAEPD